MSTIVAALWRYAGYNSLCRSLFDAGEQDLAEDKSHTGFLHLQESRNEPASPASSTGASISDDDSEGLRAWAYNLSSDEEEEEEGEEEEEDRDREDYLYEISLSDDDDDDYDYESDGVSF